MFLTKVLRNSQNLSAPSFQFKNSLARKIFITGTDTDVGKTIVSSWLSLHSGYDYFKPIFSGPNDMTSDSGIVNTLAGVKIHPQIYTFTQPLSPHLAAKIDNVQINMDSITLPPSGNLIVEGCGGLLVPLNSKDLLIDLIEKFQIPVLLVASSKLGTINHTLMSLETLRSRSIPVIGVIVKGKPNQDNCDAIQHYGKTQVLAQVPHFEKLTRKSLQNFLLTPELKKIFL